MSVIIAVNHECGNLKTTGRIWMPHIV